MVYIPKSLSHQRSPTLLCTDIFKIAAVRTDVFDQSCHWHWADQAKVTTSAAPKVRRLPSCFAFEATNCTICVPLANRTQKSSPYPWYSITTTPHTSKRGKMWHSSTFFLHCPQFSSHSQISTVHRRTSCVYPSVIFTARAHEYTKDRYLPRVQ